MISLSIYISLNPKQAGDYFIGDPSDPTGINVAALSPLVLEGEEAQVRVMLPVQIAS
jgi:hypothetical protein